MIVDMSELDGKSFACIDGCGMCCLCQPELTDEELRMFESDDFLRSGLTREHIDGRRSARPNAIKLQGGHGACYFLKNRCCTINEIKPKFCRQFPVHVHVLRRIQLNVNLSCRGVKEEKEGSMRAYGKTLISSIPENQLVAELEEARKVAHEFDERCRNAGIYQSPERLRAVATKLLPLIETRDGIAKLLAFADMEPEIGNLPEEEILSRIRATHPAKDVESLAQQSNYELFDTDDISRLPVYVDEQLRWIVFHSRAGKIEVEILEENGALQHLTGFDADDICLLQRTDDAMSLLSRYAALLIARDPFMGNVASVCDQHGYKHDLLTVYIGVLGTALLDLWWRASLIATIKGRRRIDYHILREGITAFDLDCLDAPTIGAFI
jgi:Fe-S-cluster containining protein